MKKVIITLQECLPGMKMAETIYNDYGAIIVAESTILDDHIIRKLSNLCITKIKIYDESQYTISAYDSEAFQVQYNENINVFKEILHDISSGKDIDLDKVDTVSESISIRLKENRDVISCINQIRTVDEYTYAHSLNVSLISMLIGKWLKLDSEKIKLLIQAGLLHDIGKSKVPLEILNKPQALTESEFNEIKKHTVHGYRILESANICKEICLAVLMHHEREDGTGYPTGAKSNQIGEMAKIISVADIYDAMTSNRVYREKESPFEVFELMENKTFGVLNPTVINAFLNNIAAYYIGDFVRLNNGDVGEVIYINPRNISKPIIKVGNKYIDMTVEKECKILELI